MNDNLQLKENKILLLPPPKLERRYKSSDVRPFIRIVLGALLFIFGFNFSNTAFFAENPLFGVRFLAEALISVIGGLLGLFVFPVLFLQTRDWFERVISRAVSDIINNFWVQQSKKIQEAQRLKQEKKVVLEEKKKQEEDAKKNQQFQTGILIDTSVLVDGRLFDLVKTGFFDRPLLVPQVVIDELQLISDSKDALKRQRGRRGLDIVKKLKSITKLVILDEPKKNPQVDKELVTLAKEHKLKLMTLDFNLNKVAKVSGIKVLNLNDLINSLKTVLLPGETISVKIIHEGKEKQQGVGYMPDGTMIVVEEAKSMVGKEVLAKVKRVIQGPAGKMIFCVLGGEPQKDQ